MRTPRTTGRRLIEACVFPLRVRLIPAQNVRGTPIYSTITGDDPDGPAVSPGIVKLLLPARQSRVISLGPLHLDRPAADERVSALAQSPSLD
jgi:hypothetical protein